MELGTSVVKTPEPETETQTGAWIQLPGKAPPSSNGVLKRHAPLHPHHPVVVTYKECLKNHAASIGGYALDGCGEFMPSPDSVPAKPSSLKCAACGCHRNFHRREQEDDSAASSRRAVRRVPATPTLQTPSVWGQQRRQPERFSVAAANLLVVYPSMPHVFLALSHGPSGPSQDGPNLISMSACANAASTPRLGSGSGKRFRTKLTQYQKERMLDFSEKIGWKKQKRDDDAIYEFCNEIGVERGVFKVWMHNNKNTSGNHHHHHGANAHTYHLHGTTSARALGTNGSSSSS